MSFQENKVDISAMAGQGVKPITDQRGLSWIRLQMMQQLLSSISEEKRAAPFPTQLELLKLFPESRTPLEQETIASSYPPFSDEVTNSRSVSGSCSEKQSTAQLTIFYNGEVKVYHVSADEAQAVMKLASSDGLSERASLKLSRSENQQSREVTGGLPMARKLSLQRFLQKRKGRLGSLSPYTSTSTGNKTSSKVWAEEDEDEHKQVSHCLSLPWQRCG